MKSTIRFASILMCLTAAHFVFGQTTEGIITYETKVNIHRTLPPDREAMKAMIPEFRTTQEQLIFNENESLHKPVEEEEDEDVQEGGVRMRFRRQNTETYTDQANSRRLLLQEFMGKKFLIEDSLHLTPWKFGKDTKEVKGYACKQATFYNEERKQNITAWYTDKLRPFLGPENFNTLPGAVLEIDINDGERIISAKNIELRPLKKNELKVPSGGTKTTQAEFRKMVAEQTERMRVNGANIIIR